MNQYFFLQVFFRVLIALVVLSRFSYGNYRKTVEQLYENLVMFHNKISPIDDGLVICEPEFDSVMITADGEKTMNCLDLNDPTAKADNDIKQKLNSFSPYFVFKNPKLNSRMLSILNSVFPGITSLEDPEIYKALDPVRIKLLTEMKFSNEDTLNINTENELLLRFINDILYGADKYLALFSDQWKLFFPDAIKERGLPKNFLSDIFLFHLRSSTLKDFSNEMQNQTISLIKNLMTFINSKPDKFEVMKFSYKTYKEYELSINLAPETYAIISQALATVHKFNVEDEQEKSGYLRNRNSALHRQIDDSENLIVNMQNIYKMVKVSDNFLTDYFWSRDYYKANLFDLQACLKRNGNFEHLLVGISVLLKPSILQQYIFLELIRSGVHKFQNMDYVLANITDNSNYVHLLKLIFEESPTPVNMFFPVDNGNNYMHIFQRPILSEPTRNTLEKVKIYLESVKTSDPLPFFFIHIRYLKHFKNDLMTKHFDLNTHYVINGDFSKIVMDTSIYKIDFNALKGKTLSFKELVEAARVNGLWEIFSTSVSSHLRGQVKVVNSSSLTKFLHEGIIDY